MADQKTNKDILEIVSELPKDLRDAYFSPATTEAIKETGKNNGLTIDKIGELAHETGLVMIGITPPGEYIKNLTARLKVAPEKAKAVAEEINQKVFQPVRASLKKIHGLGAPSTAPKPLPTREEIKIPPNLPVETKQIVPDKFVSKNELRAVVEEYKQKSKPKIPAIFVKNIPSFAEASGDKPVSESEKLKSELEGALNKENQKPPPAGGYQSKDPYREPTE